MNSKQFLETLRHTFKPKLTQKLIVMFYDKTVKNNLRANRLIIFIFSKVKLTLTKAKVDMILNRLATNSSAFIWDLYPCIIIFKSTYMNLSICRVHKLK